MFDFFKKKKKYEFVEILIHDNCVYKTGKNYHTLLEVFRYTIIYKLDGIVHTFTGIVDKGQNWDGGSVPTVAQCYILEPLDDIWAMETLVHDDLCNKDFLGGTPIRDKAFRALLKRSEVIVEELGDDKINLVYSAVVQYREWKKGLGNKLSHWMGW